MIILDREINDMSDGKIWVLIVDDSLVVRKLTGKLLRKEGFEILLAENGEKAMDMVEFCTPDCILLDVLMPKVHGQAFLSWLRKRDKTLPVFVVSGLEGQPGLVAAMEALSIAGWIPKPGNPKIMAKMIREAVAPDKVTTGDRLETETSDDGQPEGKTNAR